MTSSRSNFELRQESAALDTVLVPSIKISVSGGELLLAGRFDHWVPVALDASNEAEGAAQILLDVTGLAPAASAADLGADLFSFDASSVAKLPDGSFRADGIVRSGEAEGAVQAVFQTPAAHTPYIVMTVSVDRQQFPEIWEALSDVASRHVGREGQIFPRGWVRPPALAMA